MGGKLSKEELVELLKKLISGIGTEEQDELWLKQIEQSVPHPEVVNLIFWDERNLSPEEIIDEALAYKPIILGAPTLTSE